MYDKIRAELAPTGVLRAAINMSNFLLVTDQSENGNPVGVSPDMAYDIAEKLGVDVKFVLFKTPGEIADAAVDDVWDIANIGAEPERAKFIRFTTAYCEIESTYLVPAGSSLQTVEEVDSPGNKISVYARAAYGLWLCDNIKHAELVKTDGMDASYQAFVEQKLEALAGLKPRLIKDAETLPGSRVLDGQFSAVQQAIGTKPDRVASGEFLQQFVDQAKSGGRVAELIEKHGVTGRLSVAGSG
jgi:polar amino acid transport system substrate-binding protein